MSHHKKRVMKSCLNIVVSILFLLFSCNNNKDPQEWNQKLEGSKWKVVKIMDKETDKEVLPPSGNKNFEVIFRTNEKMKILNGCNFSYGIYTVNGESIKFNNLGPNTEMYCEPISNFEELFIKSLEEAKIYDKISNQLILKSDKHTVTLEYIDEYDLNKGKVLFCTNAHILNCLFEMEIKVNNKEIGVIESGSQYSDIDCHCTDSPPQIGEIYEMPKGKYEYSVKNIKCNAANTTNQWNGTFTVEGDNCVTVFLDVLPK